MLGPMFQTHATPAVLEQEIRNIYRLLNRMQGTFMVKQAHQDLPSGIPEPEPEPGPEADVGGVRWWCQFVNLLHNFSGATAPADLDETYDLVTFTQPYVILDCWAMSLNSQDHPEKVWHRYQVENTSAIDQYNPNASFIAGGMPFWRWPTVPDGTAWMAGESTFPTLPAEFNPQQPLPPRYDPASPDLADLAYFPIIPTTYPDTLRLRATRRYGVEDDLTGQVCWKGLFFGRYLLGPPEGWRDSWTSCSAG